jgi:Bacterial extracellular solute-binding protein/Binding-protein-dependent transport system inner membrane component
VVTVPYQGYEAKYLAALIGKSGAPDIFMGMTHHWCGQYDFCDPMPSDLAKTWDENLPRYMMSVGKWKGVRYGTPIEHGNFQQMYLNADLFRKAGLDPDKPPKTLEEWLAAMKKLTVLDAKGEITQAGFALRHKGHPVGITDKFLPFAHAFGARMLSPNLDKATGFANSPEMVAALTFYADHYEAASIDGASWWQALHRVTVPLLNPQIVMVTILELIFNFKVFDTVYTTTQGGPAGASQTIIMLLYDTAFKYFRLGEASVMAVFVFASLLVVTVLQWRLLRRQVEY